MNEAKKDMFWLHDLLVLFRVNGGMRGMRDISIVPMSGMSLEEQLNAATRLILIVFVIILIAFRPVYSIIFLVVSLVFIIILFYIQSRRMNIVENYQPMQPVRVARPTTAQINYHIDTNRLPTSKFGNNLTAKHTNVDKCGYVKRNPNSLRFYDDWKKLEYNENYKSPNQALVGPPHPRTKTKPIIVAPAVDLSFWKNDDLVTFPWINRETNVDLYQSGFVSTTCCGDTEGEHLVPERPCEKYVKGPGLKPLTDIDQSDDTSSFKEDFEYGDVIEGFCGGCSTSPSYDQPNIPPQKHTKHDQEEIPNNPAHPLQHEVPGLVNMQCGYNPSQEKVNLPSNYPAGNCEQAPEMANFNKNIFTQTIQPGVYTKSDIIEPINSNIGISFTQQFPPVTCDMTKDGGIEYTSHDPNLVDVKIPDDSFDVSESVTNANIYDPRHSGYGTSYRAYTEEVTGQTRFAYDDVNAVRMPNYITRNKIDFEPYADSYGPMKDDQPYGNEFNSRIRALAQDSWLRNSLQFRNDLQERTMRKTNAEAWQQKIAPIRTSTSAGQMNRCK
ncbi:hypothetical protein N9189_02090 [Pirellulaceae bacterium]|jgi:hypothetical protein|nr:hypothetical protein [Pirellulaceae bacterium]